MDNDLISREALLDTLAREWPTITDIDDYYYFVKDAPAVDAVEVVRCKDCKWCDESADFCTFWDGVRHPEHFCGEGERKDND